MCTFSGCRPCLPPSSDDFLVLRSKLFQLMNMKVVPPFSHNKPCPWIWREIDIMRYPKYINLFLFKISNFILVHSELFGGRHFATCCDLIQLWNIRRFLSPESNHDEGKVRSKFASFCRISVLDGGRNLIKMSSL